jgi:hypothetical protein
VAQWKRAGPITQRSVDRNHSPLAFFFFNNDKLIIINKRKDKKEVGVGNPSPRPITEEVVPTTKVKAKEELLEDFNEAVKEKNKKEVDVSSDEDEDLVKMNKNFQKNTRRFEREYKNANIKGSPYDAIRLCDDAYSWLRSMKTEAKRVLKESNYDDWKLMIDKIDGIIEKNTKKKESLVCVG